MRRATNRGSLFMTVGAGLLLALFATGRAGTEESARSRARAAQPVRVILDTDIGDDVDDAYALVLLASLPEVRLLGVTTGYGATRERAQVAAKLLNVLRREDVPVCA